MYKIENIFKFKTLFKTFLIIAFIILLLIIYFAYDIRYKYYKKFNLIQKNTEILSLIDKANYEKLKSVPNLKILSVGKEEIIIFPPQNNDFSNGILFYIKEEGKTRCLSINIQQEMIPTGCTAL